MTDSVYEIVVYQVTDRNRAIDARRKAMEATKTYPGFRAYRPLNGLEPETLMADLIEWDDYESAKAAGEKVKSDPAFSDIFAQISEFKLFAHFLSGPLLTSKDV